MHHNYAFDYVETLISMSSASDIYVVVEDARKRKWYGDKSNAKAQGAGAIKVICSFWEEWAKYHLKDSRQFSFEMIHPLKGSTKWNAKKFKQMTGWQGRTNDHVRDAGLIAFTYKPKTTMLKDF